VALHNLGIAFELHRFEHDSRSTDYGHEAARELTKALGCAPSSIFKSLVWSVDGSACVVVVPVLAKVSAKRLAAAMGGRKAVIADADLAERIGGSVLGAITPLALRRDVPILVDSTIHGNDRVFLSAGRRGMEVSLKPEDLIRATSAEIAPLISGEIE